MYSAGNITQLMRADLAASDTANDMCERAFGMFTHTLVTKGNIGHSSASAMASGKMNGHVVANTVVTAGKTTGSHCKGMTPVKEALLDTLPEKEAIALFEYARTGVKAFKVMDDREVQSQLAENLKSFKARGEQAEPHGRQVCALPQVPRPTPHSHGPRPSCCSEEGRIGEKEVGLVEAATEYCGPWLWLGRVQNGLVMR